MGIELSDRDKVTAMLRELRITIAATVAQWEGHDAPEHSPMMWTLVKSKMEQVSRDAATVAEWAEFKHGETAE